MEGAKKSSKTQAPMTDVVDQRTRSRMMSGIKGQNTKPELLIRRALRQRGFRFAMSSRHLPGKPDLLLPKWGVAIFVHGCFWHLHGCSLSKMPSSNMEFWAAKLNGNQERDIEAEINLLSMGWRVAVIWECSTRGRSAGAAFESMVDRLASWIRESSELTFEGSGDFR